MENVEIVAPTVTDEGAAGGEVDIARLLHDLAMLGGQKRGSGLDDPVQIAAQISREAIATSQDVAPGPHGIRELLSHRAPLDIRRRYPMEDPRHLLVLSWAATCKKSDGGLQPDNLVRANLSLLNLITQISTGDCGVKGLCSIIDACQFDCELKSFLRDYVDAKGNAAIRLDRFLIHIVCGPDRRKVEKFYQDLASVPGKIIGQLAHEGVLYKPTQGTGGEVEDFFQSLRNPVNQKIRWIAGARCQPLNGIHLRLPGHTDLPNSYDLFGVWQIRELAAGEKLTEDHFVALQGILIPADLRETVYKDYMRETRQSHIAATAARNMSHNLGSHALSHIAHDLRETDPKTALFLDYLQQRASLIAMLATGVNWPFSVAMRMAAIIDAFNSQDLLKKNLCKSEKKCNFEKVTLVSKDYRVDIPGGPSGAHAIYAIIENCARNSSKHSARSAGVNEVHIEVSCEPAAEPGWIKCTIWDKNSSAIKEEDLAVLAKALRDGRNSPGFVEVNASDGGGSKVSVPPAGLGAIEIAIWADYLAGYRSDCPEAVTVGKNDLGQLTHSFYLQKSNFVEIRSGTANSQAQFRLVRCETAEQFDRPETGRDRWVKILETGDGYRIRTRFDQLQGASVALPKGRSWRPLVTGTIESGALSTAVQAAYLKSLRNYALPHNDTRKLLLVIDDHEIASNLKNARGSDVITLPFEDISVLVVENWMLEDIRERNPNTLFAIWARHSNSPLHRAVWEDNPKDVIHYELYESTANPYRFIVSKVDVSEDSELHKMCGLLAEAALTVGKIFDERLAVSYPPDSLERKRAIRAGIELLDPCIPADTAKLRQNRIEGPARDRAQELRPAFASIHASLSRKRLLDLWRNWREFEGQLAGLYPILTRHSGGGGWKEMGPDLPFYDVHLFREWALDMQCKLCLTEALARAGMGADR